MKLTNSLPWKNCVRRPGRTIALTCLSFFLCFSLLAGALVITGLQSGLASLKARLGADIMVVPYSASTQSALDDIILQGNTGYFYMNRSYLSKVEATEGIGEITEQFFLATTTSSCCSYKVQLIGIDADTDFVITPWLELSGKEGLNYLEVYVGCDMNAFEGDQLTFYGTTVTVAGRLDRTGTYMDTAVFGTEETIRSLITNAMENEIFDFGDVDPDSSISCILINVAEGYSIEEVLNDINIHVSGVVAVSTGTMIADVSDKLTGISEVIGILIGVIWLLVLAIMAAAFAMVSNERKKEFAVLRIVGASRKKLSGIILAETAIVGVVGSVVGAAFAVLTTSLFGGFIESSWDMPFLLPSIGVMAIIVLAAIIISVAAAALAATICAHRISRVDAALILRGEN